MKTATEQQEQIQPQNNSGRLKQTREALHYPARAENVPSGQILMTQIRLSAVLLVLLLVLGRFAPARAQQLMQPYRRYMAGHNLSWREEILRFTDSAAARVGATENFTDSISAWAKQTADYTKSIIHRMHREAGIGGSGQKRQPDQYSEEGYLPDRTLSFPLDGGTVSSGYGWRDDPFGDGEDFHTGIDLASPQGSRVYAALNGTVTKAGFSASYGNYIVLNHGNGISTLYAHMQYLFVRTGQRVRQRQTIGTVGQTGAATGPHLHFELFYRDTGYDPAPALRL